MLMKHAAPARRRQAGLSIVELMVGITIGLIVVAAATVLVSTQLAENRRLLLETQLQQDLRATADIITRELRRAGAMRDDPDPLSGGILSVQTLWKEGTLAAPSQSKPNCLAHQLRLPSSGGVLFDYQATDRGYLPGPYGYRLDSTSQVIYTRLPAPGGGACNFSPSGVPTSGWQPLTDPKVMRVRRFDVTMSTPATAATVRLPCPNLCPAPDLNGTSCWPSFQVRELLVTIEGESPDGSVKRALTTRVRVRADLVGFTDPATELVCPP
jgi:type II secretory pathway pseudopilin PulG